MRLEVFRHGQLLQEVSLQDSEILVGRDESCKIRLDDRSISRKHAVFRNSKNGGIEVEKISEFGWMKLNGQNSNHSKLKSGDRLELGPFEIRFMQEKQNLEEVPAIPAPVEIHVEPVEVPVEAMAESSEPVESMDQIEQDSPFQNQEVTPDFGGDFQLPQSDESQKPVENVSEEHLDFSESHDERTRFIGAKQSIRAILNFGNGNEYEIGDDEIAIGRSQQCHVVLEDRRASRRNTLIQRRDGKYVIKDLGSANGTLLNGDRIEESELHSGDEVQVGDTRFKFEVVQADYQIKQQEFISVPQPEIQVAPPDLMPSSFQQPVREQFSMPPHEQQAPTFDAPPKKSSLLGGFIDRYRMMNTRMQIIWGAVIIFGVWSLMQEDPEEKKVKLNGVPQKRAAVQKKDDKKQGGPVSLEMLTPEQRKYIDTQYQLSFDLYKNREYDRCLLELDKIFTLIQDYKNAREIAAFAREGKRKLEAIEEERKRKEQERQTQLKLQALIEQAGHLMGDKKYKDAESIFPEIELIQPENFAVSEWRKQIVTETERIAREAEEKKRLEDLRNKGWKDFNETVEKVKARKYYEALDAFDEILSRNIDDAKLNKSIKEEIKKAESAIEVEREPHITSAKQLEKDGKLTEAYRSYQKALDADPMDEESPEGMKRIKGILSEKAKHIYTEGVFAESFGDLETAEKRYREVLEVVPVGDAYHAKAESKLKKLTVLRRSASEGSPQ